jgi:stearoyl-CoA desaturase (delta-9 desaturase)
VGWIFDSRNDATKLSKIRDFARFPELRFLNSVHLLPAVVVGAIILELMGPSGLLVGFLLSVVFCWHATFAINSLAHMWGTRPYDTDDDSRNNALLALLSCGEGWHNNHHQDMLDVRLGRRWWQLDMGWATIWLLTKLRITSSPRINKP